MPGRVAKEDAAKEEKEAGLYQSLHDAIRRTGCVYGLNLNVGSLLRGNAAVECIVR